MTTRQVLGGAVREIRKALGVSLRTLARDAELAPGYLSDIENGKKQPGVEVTKRIADRLSVSVDAITYPGARALPVASEPPEVLSA